MLNLKIVMLLSATMITGLFCAPEDSGVVMGEDFESGRLGDGWERYRNDTARGDFEVRPEYVHTGKKSYRLTALATGEGKTIRGRVYKESDSWLRAWFLPGRDLTYVRWYVKFAVDFDQGRGMHWVQFWGCRPDDPYSVLGGAGRKPDGTDRFITTLDPLRKEGADPPGQVAFYSYWPDMKQSADGYYWGNYFYPEVPFAIERGRWYCFEVMVKANEPGAKDGEQALWIDGKKIMHVREMRWRDVETLKLNMVMFGLYLGHYEQECTYWIDDVVISTNYVGPLKVSPE